MSKIQDFAQAEFGITLSSYQIDYIRALMSNNIVVMARQAGKSMAIKVLQAYVEDGLKDE